MWSPLLSGSNLLNESQGVMVKENNFLQQVFFLPDLYILVIRDRVALVKNIFYIVEKI